MPPKGYTTTTRHSVHLRRADDIAGLIKARRAVLGWSQQVLANRLTVSRKWVNEVEQGNSNAKLGLVLRALNELGIDLYGTAPPAEISNAKAGSIDDVDIDAIADMTFPAPRGKS